jgi:hypothetical protein
MFPKPIVFLALLGAAVGVPYASSNFSKGGSGGWLPFGGSDAPESAPTELASSESLAEPPVEQQHLAAPGAPPPAPLEGLRVYSLAEVLRTDISPNWVYQRWQRKSTSLPSLEYHGIRVPLVTGTRADDVAGSLTYYFDDEGRCEKLVFRGITGDSRRLVALMTGRYGFLPQKPDLPGEHLYENRWNGRAMSRLRIKPSSVLTADSLHSSFAVELDLQRPGAVHYLDRDDPPPMPKVEEAPQEVAKK